MQGVLGIGRIQGRRAAIELIGLEAIPGALGALGRRMPEGVSWTETQGGFSLLLELPEGLDAATLLPRALERGVAFTPGNAFFSDGGGERSLRLSFSAVPFGQIEEGVRRLADSIREAQRRPERGARERGRIVERAIAAEKLGAVAGP